MTQAPMTPADCDLRDFAFMPLDVVRLRDSDLVAMESAEAFRAAVMLWCASWHQMPAASLPDDDRVLSNLAGFGRVVKEWLKERNGALRGWVKCTDGRLYHPVVSEKAVEAWRGKLERQWRTECARIKKHAQRHNLQVVVPEFDEWMTAGRPQGQPLVVPKDTADMSHGHQQTVPDLSPGKTPPRDRDRDSGQGQGQGQLKKKKGAKAPMSAENLPTWMRDLVGMYHEMLPELPGVRVMDKQREQVLHDFRDWVLNSRKPDGQPRATNDSELIEWSRGYFERARSNDFIMGRGPRSPDHANWRCTLEYLLSSRGVKKVVEETEAA